MEEKNTKNKSSNPLTVFRNKLQIDEFKKYSLQLIPNINQNASFEYFDLMYYNYLENYTNIVKLQPSRIKFSSIGFFSKTNINIQYWTDRGWSIDEANSFIAKRQATCTPKVAEKIQKTLNSKSKEEIELINAKKGNGLNVEWLVQNKGISKETAEDIIFNRCSHAGRKKVEKYKLLNKPFSDRQLEYFLEKGMTAEEAKKALKNRQTTTTLQAFVKKYGYEEGLKRYNSRVEKFKENWSQKSEEERSKINLKKILRNKFFSNESFLFFKQLVSNINLENFQVRFGHDEIYIYNEHLKKIFFYDFCIPELKIIIEYHGSLWHANPLKPKTEWKNKLYSYDESLERDQIKRKTAEDLGYNYIEIWDYQRSDIKTINEILNIITKNVTIYDSNTNHTTNS